MCGQFSLIGEIGNGGWNRDQYMGGLQQLGKDFNSFIKHCKLEEILKEKEEAVEIWKKIESIAAQLPIKNKETKEFIQTSYTYGRIKYEVIANGWKVMLLGLDGDKKGDYDKPRMSKAIARYDELWVEWKKLEQSSPSCATIYKNNYCRYVSQKGMFPATGMNDSINKYREPIKDKKRTNE